MKKLVSVLLALCLLMSASALAEGKLTVSDKNLILFAGEDTGYFYAKVTNTGDEKVGTDSGKLVIFSTDDDLLVTESYVSTYPSYVNIEPGDYLYIREYLWESALNGAEVGDYKFSMSEKDRNADVAKLPCEAELVLSKDSEYDNYVNVTFTNTLDDVLKEYTITAAIYDNGGNLVFVDSSSYSNIYVHPGSSITVSMRIDSKLIKHYAVNSLTPETVDAMVCYEK